MQFKSPLTTSNHTHNSQDIVDGMLCLSFKFSHETIPVTEIRQASKVTAVAHVKAHAEDMMRLVDWLGICRPTSGLGKASDGVGPRSSSTSNLEPKFGRTIPQVLGQHVWYLWRSPSKNKFGQKLQSSKGGTRTWRAGSFTLELRHHASLAWFNPVL